VSGLDKIRMLLLEEERAHTEKRLVRAASLPEYERDDAITEPLGNLHKSTGKFPGQQDRRVADIPENRQSHYEEGIHMLILKNMTLAELRTAMVERGLSIGLNKLKAAVDAGVFPFAHVIPMSQDEYIILQKDFEIWADAHSVEVEESA